MIPELVGRLPVITVLNELDRDAMVKIMTEPKNSLIKQYTRLFELDGVELDFKKDAIEAIADITIKKNTGARGLKSVIENVLMKLMYSIPSDSKAEKVIITEDVILGKGEPIILRNQKKETRTLKASDL